MTESKGKESKLPAIDPSTHPKPYNLAAWIEQNKADLKPPVGNKMIHGKGCQFKVMVVGGPNTRTDYHIDEGEEWFYMVKGDMVLKIVDHGVFRDVAIREGETFLLPGRVPHSPQRGPDSIGLVIERERMENELDGLRWYCQDPSCRAVVFEEFFVCEDLGSQLKTKITRYYGDEKLRVCPKCKKVDQAAKPSDLKVPARGTSEAKALDVEDLAKMPGYNKDLPGVDSKSHLPPLSLQQWIADNRKDLTPPIGNKMIFGMNCQFKVMAVGGPNTRTDYHIDEGEEWFWQVKGDMVLKVVDGGVHRDIAIKEGECFLLPGNVPHSPQRKADTVGIVVERERIGSELDGLRWYCHSDTCKGATVTYEHYFKCEDLGSQLKVLINAYYGSDADAVKKRTCPKCGTVDQKPAIAAPAAKAESKS